MTPNFEAPPEEYPQFGTLLMINIEQFFYSPNHLPNPRVMKLSLEFTSHNKVNVQFFL
jgi:hypothetical protein